MGRRLSGGAVALGGVDARRAVSDTEIDSHLSVRDCRAWRVGLEWRSSVAFFAGYLVHATIERNTVLNAPCFFQLKREPRPSHAPPSPLPPSRRERERERE